MTIVDPDKLYSSTELYGQQDLRYPAEPEAPSMWNTVKAAVEKSSLTANIVQQKEDESAFRDAGPTDPTYDPAKDMKGYEDHFDYLFQAQNAKEMELRKGVIDRNNATNNELAAAGWKGIAANTLVGILDPLSLATLAVPITGGLRAATTIRGALAGAATLGTLAAGEESVLRSAQPGRTDVESIYGVGGGVLFGSVFGGIAGKIAGARTLIRQAEHEALGAPLVTSKGTSPLIDFKTALEDKKAAAVADGSPEALDQLAKMAEWEKAGHEPQAIVRAIDEATTPDKVVIEPTAADAAAQAEQNGAIDKMMGADDSVGAMRAGDALQIVGGKGTLWAARATPLGRLAQASVDEAVNLGLRLNNSVMRFISRRTGLPEAAPAAADTELKKWTWGGLSAARRVWKEEFNKYRTRVISQGGKAVSYNKFRQAVGEASREGGENHPIPEARVAAVRGRTVDHGSEQLFREGIHARLFDPVMRALAHRESAEPYRMHLGKTKMAHKEMRAIYKQASRDARQALRSERGKGVQALKRAKTEQLAAVERAYDWHKAKTQEQASHTLAEQLQKVDEADTATRAQITKNVRAQFDERLKEIEAQKKALQARLSTIYGANEAKMFSFNIAATRIAKAREDANTLLETRLKTVDFTDTVARAAITKDVQRQLRLTIRVINKEQTEAEKRVGKEARRARAEIEKQWRKDDRELTKQLDTDLDEVAASFKELSPAEFAEAVHLAVVGDSPPEYLSPIMREVVDAVKGAIDKPAFKNYLTRVFDQVKIKADGGQGLTRAIQDYFLAQFTKTPLDPTARAAAEAEAKRIADESLQSIRGMGGTARSVGLSNIPIKAAAQQLQRVLAVPDSVLAPWLHSDIDAITTSYARAIGSRLELAKISKDYGKPGAWRLAGDRTDIQDRYYERMRAAAPKEAERLKKEHDQVQKDLEATAERTLGVYDLPNDPTAFLTRVAGFLKHTNFLSRMGGMVSASFSDVAAPALAMGLARGYGPALAAMTQGTLTAALKMSLRQLQSFGTACELLTPLWSHVPTEAGEIAQPALQAVSQVFSHMTGITVWNTFGKALSGVMLQHDMLSLVNRLAGKDLKTLSKADTNALSDLARYGIRTDMIDAIAKQPVQKFGTLRMADTDAWTDPALVNHYRNALVKMVDSFIITPSAGDKFRMIRGPWPGLVAQFQSFAMAAHNKAMIPFLQDPKLARQATGLAAAAFMGAMTYASRMAIAGKYDQVQKMLDENDYYGLSRQVVANSSLLTIPSAAENMLGSTIGLSGAGRFANSGTETFLGPSAGLLDNAVNLTKLIGSKGEFTASSAHKVRNMLPFNQTWAGNLLLNPSGTEHGLPGLGGEEAIVKALDLKERPK